MNKLPRNLGASRPIDIGAEPDFSLGGLSVHPSLREVGAGDRRESVEPRVMQVLVALVRAEGGVLSRDRLIEQCWGGRLVGDDAINSSVAKVRALAALTTPPAFEIETIPRVGYRLHARTAPEMQPSNVSSSVTEPSVKPKATELRFWQGAAIAGACVVALAGALIWRFFGQDKSLEWDVVESHQPFIGTSLIERYPALSPDGAMLAYSAGPNITSRQIYLRILKGDSSIQLTHETYDAVSPVWSPDGRSIAYSVFQSGQPCRIMEMQVPSGAPREVGRCRRLERAELAFDPSGQALVFSDSLAAGMPTRIVKLDIETGQVTTLTDPLKAIQGDVQPSFSPDGRYFAYVRLIGDVRGEIRLRRLSDGNERVIDALHDCDIALAWTPDGKALLTSRACVGNYTLRTYAPDGRGSRQIMVSPNEIGRLSVNADGYVAMETAGGHTPILAFKPNSAEPPKVLDDGSEMSTLCADFAADGTLVVTGRTGSEFGVWIADREGAPFRKLMPLTRFPCAIRWSPDGTRFAFLEPADIGFDIPVVSRSGEVLTRLHLSEKDSGLLDWTADGKSILTTRLEKAGWRIWRTDLVAPFKSMPITPYGWTNPRVHGSMLFAQKEGAIGTWRLDTGVPERVADGPTPEATDLSTISGDRIFYADLTDPRHPAISAQSVAGGEKKRLMPLPFGAANFTFAVNPKSGDIVFSPPADDIADIGLVRLQRR